MRTAPLLILTAAALALAGCVADNGTGNALRTQVYTEGAAVGMGANAINRVASLDPTGMAAGPTYALTRSMVRASHAQTNARVMGQIMAQEAAIDKCFQESKSMPEKAGYEYTVACAKRVRGIQ